MRRTRFSTPTASVLLAVLVLTVFSTTGCRWFRKDTGFQQTGENRPLEVPPDLDRPNTDAALGGAGSVSRSSLPSRPAASGAVAAQASGFTVQGERDAVFTRVGDALAAIPGVTIASRAQLLGSYDVNYEGANFLVRVAAADGGVQVSAVDPRGVAAGGEAPAKLIAALRTALGG